MTNATHQVSKIAGIPSGLKIDKLTVDSVFTVIILTLVFAFFRKFGENLADKFKACTNIIKQKTSQKYIRDLKNHPWFKHLKSNINVNVHNIDYICQLRRLVFVDMIIALMDSLNEESIKLIETDNYLKLNSDDFNVMWEQFERNVNQTWFEKCDSMCIPEFAFIKFNNTYQVKIKIINGLISSVCTLEKYHKSNYDKTMIIFDMLKSIHYTIMLNVLEDTFKHINGDFIDLTYKNITCLGVEKCHMCQKNYDKTL